MTTRRIFLAGLFAVAAALPHTVSAQGDKVMAVVNARNPTAAVTAAELKNIYLGNTAFWHGVVPMKVYARPVDSAAGSTFLSSVLGMNGQRFTAHWQSRELAGQGVAPPTVDSVDELAGKIKSSPGAIGFILASEAWSTPPAGVRIIEVR